MWESALYNKLVADEILIKMVSSHCGYPSIFSNSAPENVAFPYIVFTIAETSGPDSAVDVFSVTIDHFDFVKSAYLSRLAAKRLIELLDREHLDHHYYKTIRIFKSWAAQASRVNEDRDPRAQHYIVRFTARAGRKGWINHEYYGKDQYGDVGYDQFGNPALGQ